MKRMRMYDGAERTFEEGVEEYILDMKARNLRDGTINHYRQSTKQIYKRVPPETAISSFSKKTIDDFYVALREDKNLNDVSMGTYARDLKTLMRFFMKKGYLPHFDIPIPKADKQPIETYTDEELKRLLKKPDVNKCNFANYRTWVIICLLLSTGMRQNSLINLRVNFSRAHTTSSRNTKSRVYSCCNYSFITMTKPCSYHISMQYLLLI